MSTPSADYVAPADSPERTAERLGCSIEWAHEHTGWHTCIDGRTYDTSCLVRDPNCDSVARGFIRRAQIDGSERDEREGKTVVDAVGEPHPFDAEFCDDGCQATHIDGSAS